MIINHVVLIALSLVLSGSVSHYAPGVMEKTIKIRQAGRTEYNLPQKLPPVDGFIAMAEEEHIGKIVFARPQGKEKRWESFLVTDCADRNDRQSTIDHRSGYEWMISEGIIAEVDYETAVRWGKTSGGIPAKIIVPPENAIVIQTASETLPNMVVQNYTKIRLDDFTILIPK
ncbi:MAG: hypothetical protein ACOC6Q_02210 [Patescibacteria group bacterium]